MSKVHSEDPSYVALKKACLEAEGDDILTWGTKIFPGDVLALMDVIETLEARVDRMRSIIDELRKLR